MAELAGVVLSPMIKAMLTQAISRLSYNEGQHKGVKEELDMLNITLIRLEALVAGVEWRQTKDERQASLLRQLRDGVVEADGVLDELDYLLMKARAKEAQGTVSRAASSSLKFAKRLVGRAKLRARLTEILKELNNVASKFYLLPPLDKNFAAEQADITSSRSTTPLLRDTDEIVGRDKEKEEIVRLLLKTADELECSDTRIPVIAIAGVGGVGKTTLAQLVYNDSRIKDQFCQRMWICVSDIFDETRLTTNILECMSNPNEVYEGIMDFDELQRAIQTNIKSKRFLLVLDDVWIDEGRGISQNEEMWRKLLLPLEYGARDSKILVTTRMNLVAEIFHARNLISLKGLTDDENWFLLKNCIFGEESTYSYPELQQIGKPIVKRLNGIPLAAKVVGGVLKNTWNTKKRMEFLETGILNNVLLTLRLSFQHLPDYLKPCLAYCSVFPKHWVFKPKDLVILWIAQGYIVAPIASKSQLLEIGMKYFNELLSRSFFQRIEQCSQTYYVIPILLHELVQTISVEDCFRIDDWEQKPIAKNTILHLGVAIHNEHELEDCVNHLKYVINFKNLRSLIFFCNPLLNCGDLPLGMFMELRSLHVLDFGGLGLEGSPTALVDLLPHLRYLNLSNNRFEILSNSLPKLISFGEVFGLRGSALEFRVRKKKGHGIEVLKDMSEVLEGKLCIKNLENANGKEAIEAELGRTEGIDGLRLEWDSSRNSRSDNVDAEVLEGLRPHPNLKQLEIEGFQGTTSPSWLQTSWLTVLEIVRLSNCRCLKSLPPLGQLPRLKELRISRLHGIKRVGGEFHGVDNSYGVRGFPCLEVLEFEDLPEWSEWCGEEDVFPCLRRLVVQGTPKLMLFPLIPPTLREIVIRNTGLITNAQWRHLSSSSSSSECFALESSLFPSRDLLHRDLLAFVVELEIRDCKEPMPAGGLLGLISLKVLRIEGCPELLASAIPDEEEDGCGVLPSSLESLVIDKCRVTYKGLSRCLQGSLTSLSYLGIFVCTQLTSLPSAKVLHHLTALRLLRIWGCTELMSLGGLHALGSLRYLEIAYFPEVKSLSEEGLPASVKHLGLWGCNPVLEQQIQEKKGREWEKVAHIPHVEIEFCSVKGPTSTST